MYQRVRRGVRCPLVQLELIRTRILGSVQIEGIAPLHAIHTGRGIGHIHAHLGHDRHLALQQVAELDAGVALRSVGEHRHDHVAVGDPEGQPLIRISGASEATGAGHKLVARVRRHAQLTVVRHETEGALTAVDEVTRCVVAVVRIGPGKLHDAAVRCGRRVQRRRCNHRDEHALEILQLDRTVIVLRVEQDLVGLLANVRTDRVPREHASGRAYAG